MTNVYKDSKKLPMKARLFQIAVKALEKDGWTVEPIPGSGKGSVRRITRDKDSRTVSIRTTQDTYIAFPRDPEDSKWVTLSEVDTVVAVSVDDRANPQFALVHMLDGDDMRRRFDRAYAARLQAGHSIPVGRGVWVGLYVKEANEPPSYVGGGAGLEYPEIARVPLGKVDLVSASVVAPMGNATPDNWHEEEPLTIGEAKRRLAQAFGVDPSNVKITIEA
jgi:hypothetical protein